MPPSIIDIGRLATEMPSTAVLTVKLWDGYKWIEYEVEGAILSINIQQSRQPIYKLGRRDPVSFTGGRTDRLTLEMTPNTIVSKAFNQDGQEIETKIEQTKIVESKQTRFLKSILFEEDEEG